MLDAVAFGEIIADGFPKSGTGPEQLDTPEFDFRLGGAPVNTAAGLATLGLETAVICRVGNDELGELFTASLARSGVQTDYILHDDKYPTTQAHVTLTGGDRKFTFVPGAHAHITPAEVSLPETRLLHIGSLLQIDLDPGLATKKLMNQADGMQAIISYDPNIRMALWGNEKRAKLIVTETLALAHIVKVSEEEAIMLSGAGSIEEATEILLRPKNQILIVTMAERGCFYRRHQDFGYLPTIPVTAVDTTGAGDAFNSGFQFCALQSDTPIHEMTTHQIETALRFGMVTGSLTATKYGAIDAFPSFEDINAYESFIISGNS